MPSFIRPPKRPPRVVTDWDNVERAREILGLKHGVEIWRRHMVHASGRYNHRPTGKHRVTIDTNLFYCTLNPSDVCWHELTHALQHERYGGAIPMMEEYYRQMAEVGLTKADLNYGKPLDVIIREIPMEKEAIANEEKYGLEIPLFKWEKQPCVALAPADVDSMLATI